MNCAVIGLQKTALFGILSPEVVEGYDKKTPGVVAKVRHNFRKKEVLEHYRYTGNEEELGTPRYKDKLLKPDKTFYSLSSSGTYEPLSARANKKLLSDPKFLKAYEEHHAHKASRKK